MHKPFYYYNTMARRCGKRKNSPAKKTAGRPNAKRPAARKRGRGASFF